MSFIRPAVIALVCLIVTASAQTGPYGLKDDVLGMSLQSFKEQHQKPGVNEVRNVCENGKCSPKEVWVPVMKCKDHSKRITTCWYHLSIAGVGARGLALFIDSQLAMLAYTLGTSDFPKVAEALLSKFGTPQTDMKTSDGRVIRWMNEISLVDIREHMFLPSHFDSPTDTSFLQNRVDEMEFIMTGQVCGQLQGTQIPTAGDGAQKSAPSAVTSKLGGIGGLGRRSKEAAGRPAQIQAAATPRPKGCEAYTHGSMRLIYMYIPLSKLARPCLDEVQSAAKEKTKKDI